MSQPVTTDFTEELDTRGFAILPNALPANAIEALIRLIQPSLNNPAVSHRQSQTYAIRNLLNVVPELRAFVESKAIRQYVEPVLGKEAQVTRGIFFDKSPKVNWKVSWHQDVTITVSEKKETSGFTNWTIKADVPHVQPPIDILEHIVTLRVHLDDTDETNGALRVIPGSHRKGRLSDSEILAIIQSEESATCRVDRGGILVMRPLLLHSSLTGEQPIHRRVIHLEFSNALLPNGLEWYGS